MGIALETQSEKPEDAHMDNAPFFGLPNDAKTEKCNNSKSMRAPNPNRVDPAVKAQKQANEKEIMNHIHHARK